MFETIEIKFYLIISNKYINMKIQFTLTVNLIYNDGGNIVQTYELSWKPDSKSFEDYMFDVMNTIYIGEEPGTLKSIDIKDLDVIQSNDLDLSEIMAFKKKNFIKS